MTYLANIIKLLIIGALLPDILSNEKIRKYLFGFVIFIIISSICSELYIYINECGEIIVALILMLISNELYAQNGLK